MELMHLQNGSDIRGVALANEAGRSVDLTEEAVRRIGVAFVSFLKERTCKETGLRISVGRDSRLSGPQLLLWLCEAMAGAGAEVTDIGLASTPAMFLSTVTEGYRYDGAVMITASHLPPERNGFKFFTAAGGTEKADIRAILRLAENAAPVASGTFLSDTFMDVYALQLIERVRRGAGMGARPLEGLRVVVDAGNGAGGFFASKVLQPLGADTTGSRYLAPDGRFPNHIPNPEDETAMASIREAVLASNADLGVIFDTDVDRAGAVLPDGSELNRNRLIALLAAILLKEHPATTIVTDSITSDGLTDFITGLGGVHRRFMRGYRNVINEALRLNAAGVDCQLAMETSGHGALKENYFLDDGAYLMVRLLIELAKGRAEGQTLAGRIADLREPADSREFRMALTGSDPQADGKAILAALKTYAADREGWSFPKENHEGVRIDLDAAHGKGWFLLRLSLHDPLLPLNIESDEQDGVRHIAGELSPFLMGCANLDASALVACAAER